MDERVLIVKYVNKEALREEFEQMLLCAYKDNDENAIEVMNSVMDVLDEFRGVGIEENNNDGNAWRKITKRRPPKICTHVIILRRDGRYEIVAYKPVQGCDEYKLFAWSADAQEYCVPVQNSEVRVWRKIPKLPKWCDDAIKNNVQNAEESCNG